MPLTYTDRDDAPIDGTVWRELRANDVYRTVGRDFVTVDGDRALVSTQWYGVVVHTDHGDLEWKFLTLICTRNDETRGDGWTRTYDTLADADAGHRSVVAALREGRWPA